MVKSQRSKGRGEKGAKKDAHTDTNIPSTPDSKELEAKKVQERVRQLWDDATCEVESLLDGYWDFLNYNYVTGRHNFLPTFQMFVRNHAYIPKSDIKDEEVCPEDDIELSAASGST